MAHNKAINSELDNWLTAANECICNADDVDYCTCTRDHTIQDFCKAHNYPVLKTKNIWTAYVIAWRDDILNGVPYITLDNKQSYPVTGVEVSRNALIIEVTGVMDDNGRIHAEDVKILVTK